MLFFVIKEAGMSLKSLTGEKLYQAFSSGAYFVIKNRENLNRINVFPVPDSDTGTNLAATLNSVIRNTKVSPSAGLTMRSMAEQALLGARGNSGIIFAQFLYGMSESLSDEEEVTPSAFKNAAVTAAQKAYGAMSTPVEGTMLTVMKAWADSLRSVTHRVADFGHLFSDSLKAALESLKRTPEKLKVLKEAQVVDAGAKGFVHFIQGIVNFMKTGQSAVIDAPVPQIDTDEFHDDVLREEELTFRYCTEAIIKTGHWIRFKNVFKGSVCDRVRNSLNDLGDSLIVAGGEEQFRIHIHSDRPSEVMQRLREFGIIQNQKSDDMLRQYETRFARKYPIALVTDSVCDLPREIMDRYQIHMVPLNVIMEDTEYLDKITMTPHEFYNVLDDVSEYPTTSQPPVSQFENLYEFLSKYYESVISIHLSSKLSGTYNAAASAAEKFPGVTVIDSKTLSGSLGLVVLKAAQAIDDGLEAEEITRKTREWSGNASIFVSVQTLKYMVRGGRVSALKGKLAKVMNLKPIVSIDKTGKSDLHGKAFSTRANRRKILGMVRKEQRNGPVTSYAVVHAHAQNEADVFVKDLERLLGKDPEYVMDISPVVGLNAGKGAVAVVTLKE